MSVVVVSKNLFIVRNVHVVGHVPPGHLETSRYHNEADGKRTLSVKYPPTAKLEICS